MSIEERRFVVEGHSSFLDSPCSLLDQISCYGRLRMDDVKRIELVRGNGRAVMVSLLVANGVCASSWVILSSIINGMTHYMPELDFVPLS